MLARFFLIIAVVAWGWSFIAAKICLDYITPTELVGMRLLIGVPVMVAAAVVRKVRLSIEPALRGRLLIASVVLTLHFLIQTVGLKYTSATNTAWIIAVIPLALVVMSYLFLKERIDKNDRLGIAVATIGIVILVSQGRLGNLAWIGSIGDWLILASAHTWALYTVITRDAVRRWQPLAVTVNIFMPIAALMLVYMIFFSDWDKLVNLPAEPVIAMAYLGLVSLTVAHWFWQEGVARLGAAKAGLFLYLEPLATTALAVPLLSEFLGMSTVIGGLMVLGGVYWSQRKRR